MLTWIRKKFGKAIIGGIIGLIVLIFIFSGILSPKATRGLHEGAVAGTVNGDAVSLAEFNRDLNRRLEIFRNFGGGKISEEQLKSLRIREMVFQDLVSRKLLIQEATRRGLMAADEEVKSKIQEIPSFQKDGKFDVTTYKQILESNNYSAGGFEKLVREDLSAQRWDAFFKSRVRVSEEELKREFVSTQEKRKLKYVLLTPETVQGNIAVTPAEIQKFLADPARLAVAKQKFEGGKSADYAGKKFEAVQEQIARGILAESKVDEVQKQITQVADAVMAKLSAAPLGSEVQLNAMLKPLKVVVKTSGWMTRKEPFIPGFGSAQEVMADAFSEAPSKVKKYQAANRFLIAWVDAKEKADLAQLEAQRSQLMQQMTAKKSRDLFQAFMKKLTDHAKIDPNPAVLQSDG